MGINSNSRNQELTKICEVRFIFRQYNWIFYVSCNSRMKNTDGLYYMSLYVEKESVVDPHSGYFATPRHHRKNYVPSTRKLHFHHVGPFSENLYIECSNFRSPLCFLWAVLKTFCSLPYNWIVTFSLSLSLCNLLTANSVTHKSKPYFIIVI